MKWGNIKSTLLLDAYEIPQSVQAGHPQGDLGRYPTFDDLLAVRRRWK